MWKDGVILILLCSYFTINKVYSQHNSQCIPGRGICIPKCCPKNQTLSDIYAEGSHVTECRIQIPVTNASILTQDIPSYDINLNGSVQYHYGTPACAPDKLLVFSSMSSDVPLFTKDQDLIIESKKLTFTKGSFCVDYSDTSPNTTEVFYVVCSEGPAVFYKCCMAGQKYDVINEKCVIEPVALFETPLSWLPSINTYDDNGTFSYNVTSHDVNVMYGEPVCPEEYYIEKEMVDDKMDHIDHGWQLSPAGHLSVSKEKNVAGYCVDEVLPQSDNKVSFHIAEYCVKDIYAKCNKLICYQKCCPAGQAIMEGQRSCADVQNDTQLWKPQFSERYFLGNIGRVTNVDLSKYHQVEGLPKCKLGLYALDVTLEKDDGFGLLENGDLYVMRYRDVTLLRYYCIDNVVNFETGLIKEIAAVCFPETEQEENDKLKFILYPIGLFISIIFLAATFVVYAVIPELQNLHGKTLLSHVAALFTAYLFLFIVQVAADSISTNEKVWCKAMGVIIQYSFLAAFFWLSAMCFDIWWTFSGLRPLRGGARERDHKKFILYSLYSWGCPMIFLIVTVSMDFAENIPAYLIKPNFGVKSCWFGGDWAIFAYFYGPIAVLLLWNLLFFVLTARKLIQVHRDTRFLDKDGNKGREKDKQRTVLYLKLFVVMGITWLLEVISWAAGGPTAIWYLPDIANTLQGVFIFIIFVCKRKTFLLLRGKVNRTTMSWRSGTNSLHHASSVSASRGTAITSMNSESTMNTRSTSVHSNDEVLRKSSEVSSPRNSDYIGMKTLNGNP